MRNDVLIVGGGPAGLLLSDQFRRHGIRHRLLERGRAAQAWRNMRPGMVLLSPSVPGRDWTSLDITFPLWAMPGTRRPFPTREDFLSHVDAFVRERGVRTEENVEVLRAAAVPEGFRVATSRGEVAGRFLVLATGAASIPVLPDIPGLRGNPRVLHSCDFVHGRGFADRRVLVLGGGNSAAEICLELAGTARVTMCTRGPVRYFAATGDLHHIRGASESLLKEMFRFGIVRLREDDPPVEVAEGRVRFAGGDEETFDWILCATGYRPSILPLDGGQVANDGDGYPVISRTGESTVPGLYFCGSLARFHRRCAFIHGFRNYVEKVFWDIADRL